MLAECLLEGFQTVQSFDGTRHKGSLWAHFMMNVFLVFANASDAILTSKTASCHTVVDCAQSMQNILQAHVRNPYHREIVIRSRGQIFSGFEKEATSARGPMQTIETRFWDTKENRHHIRGCLGALGTIQLVPPERPNIQQTGLDTFFLKGRMKVPS